MTAATSPLNSTLDIVVWVAVGAFLDFGAFFMVSRKKKEERSFFTSLTFSDYGLIRCALLVLYSICFVCQELVSVPPSCH